MLWVVACASHAGQIYVLHLESGELTRISQDLGREFGSPTWSPDGKWIACDSWPVGRTLQASEVGVLPSGGGELRTFGPGAMPSWSPDGSQFACHTYGTNVPNGRPQIVVVNADGSGREPLFDQWGSPRWMPDGKSIVTIFNGGLARYDLATGKQSMLTGNLMVRPGFAYSDKRNAFCVPSESQALYLIEPDETGGWRNRLRLNAATRVGHMSWSPDGKRIVFGLGSIENYCRLCFIDADGEAPPVHVPGIPAQWICCNPNWSPDGKQIVFVRIDMDVEWTEVGGRP